MGRARSIKYGKFGVWRLRLVTVLLLPATVECSLQGETPPDQTPQVVTDAVQTSAQLEAYQALAGLYNLQDMVAGAFLRTADIDLNYHDTNDNLPAPQGSPYYPDWPDARTFQTIYQDYAATYHDVQNYPWVIFYVNHFTNNSTTQCAGMVTGFTNPYPVPNAVQSAAVNRWSFMFVTDVRQQIRTLCQYPEPGYENSLIHFVAHEYGHQRAGLTDNALGTNRDLYHTGSVPQNREDVMTIPGSPAEYAGYQNPVFDSRFGETAGEHLSCRANLLTNQSVH